MPQTGWLHHLFQLYLLGVLFAYFSAFWLRSGQTLAMKTWRIRLVNPDGSPIDAQAGCAAIRRSPCSVCCWRGAGFWWALFDRDRQFFHDRIVGTRLDTRATQDLAMNWRDHLRTPLAGHPACQRVRTG